MDSIYRTALLRIEVNDRKWVKELFKWVLHAELSSIEELKEAVELSLEDDLLNSNLFGHRMWIISACRPSWTNSVQGPNYT